MTYFIGAYWGQREESRQACAKRLSDFIHRMELPGLNLSRWFKKGSSRNKPLIEFPRDPAGLEPFLKTNRRDIGGDTITELGFNFAAWTGKGEGAIASIAMTCGAYCPVIRNSVVVSFDPSTEAPTLELLEAILKAAVAAFDPEDAVASSTEILASHVSLPVWEAPAIFRYKHSTGFVIGGKE